MSQSNGIRWFPSILPSNGAIAAIDTDDDGPEEAVEVEEDLALDDRSLPLALNSDRHLEDVAAVGDSDSGSWRLRDRMKTVSVALVICLNVGTDPPDVIKTQPCARVECWIDPNTLNAPRALDMIGGNLQKQYERWQSRARYKQGLDPTVDEVRRLTTGLRRNARDERVLFHYNGHGVPKPTAAGEIWVFNRSYTQYIPLSLYDLQAWIGSPSVFVWDCSNAGIIVSSFERFAEQHDRDYAWVNAQGSQDPQNNAPHSSFKSCIQLAACSATQLLPMNPDLPADLFTSCLTTPIKMALRWFVMQDHGKLAPRITVDMLDKIPGQVSDRRTMLGELNWIFTAITDTIAWNTIPKSLFQRLFRQDLLVASLFRNFLLAGRVMRSYDCTPVSQPSLPPTHQHPMWQAWDLAVDMSLSQLPGILENKVPYKASSFFEEQLTAFEMWLKYGNEQRPPPEQLPIVLQVLLSQAHRLRALELLGNFLDLGPWAVNLALSVGIFPYVLRLLQSSARELRPYLVSIWAKILAVDTSYQADLIRESSHRYFLGVLQDECMMPRHRTWAAFILASIVNDYQDGQKQAEMGNLIAISLEYLEDDEPLLRQWLAIAMGRVWDKYEPARWRGARNNAHEKLYGLLKDPVAEVRAAAVFALGTFINSCEERTEHANSLDHTVALHIFITVSEDASPLVRQELVVALQYVVMSFESNFVAISRQEEEESLKSSGGGNAKYNAITSAGSKRVRGDSRNISFQPSQSSSALDRLGSRRGSGGLPPAVRSIGGTYLKLWNGLVLLASDPHPEVARVGQSIVGGIREKAKKSIARLSNSSLDKGGSVPSSPTKSSFLKFKIDEETSKEVLTTEFLPWSAKYFNKQLTRSENDGDHESSKHWRKEWLYNRNHDVRISAEFHHEIVRKSTFKIDQKIFGTKHNFPINTMAFHPYNSKIVAGGSTVQMWDVESGELLSSPKFELRSKRRGQITSLDYVNAHQDALLLVACDDGTIRLFKDSEEDSRIEHRLVTAWNGLREIQGYSYRGGLTPVTSGLPVHSAWSQFDLTLGVGGDSRYIRLWDMERELKKSDLNTHSDSFVSSLTFSSYYSASSVSGIFAAGFGDGSIKLFDIRTPDAKVCSYGTFENKVLCCRLQETSLSAGNQKIIAGSADGEVRIIDLRKTSNPLTCLAIGHAVSSMHIHQNAPLLASWSSQGVAINSWRKVSGETFLSNVNLIKYHDEGVLGQRLGPGGNLMFHPHLAQVAIASRDGNLSVRTIRKCN